MFAYLIQERIEEPSLSSVFFDQGVRVLTGLGLNSLTGDKRTNTISVFDRQTLALSDKDAETPLWILVACFNELANVFSVSRKPLTLSDILAKRKRKTVARSNTLESSGSYDSNGNNENGSLKLIEKRHELAEAKHGLDLQLDDMGKGPLIIPGPSKGDDLGTATVFDQAEDEFELEMERPSSVRYRYNGGWPDLDVALLNSVQNFQQGLELLRKNRIKSLKQVRLSF
jgi:hypothetical protein